jgi:partitioning defective protein 6
MSKNYKHSVKSDGDAVEVKSKFDAEFRRFSVKRGEAHITYEAFRSQLEKLHALGAEPFLISYTDPRDGDLLPINNDENFGRALKSARPLLRVLVQRKGESLEEYNGYGTNKTKNLISHLLGTPKPRTHLPISNPHDFRQVRTSHRTNHIFILLFFLPRLPKFNKENSPFKCLPLKYKIVLLIELLLQ